MFVSVNVYVVTLRSSGKLTAFIVIYWSLQNDKMHANWADILTVSTIYSLCKHHRIKTKNGN